MKRLLTFILPILLLVFSLSFASNATVYATDADSDAMTEVGESLDALVTFMDENTELETAAYYEQFVAEVGDTRKVVSRSHAALANTTEIGETGEAVEEVRKELAILKRQLAEWQETAVAQDDEAFVATGEEVSVTIEDFNAAIDVYNAAYLESGSTDEYATNILIAIGAIVVASPVIFLWRNKVHKRNRKHISVANNKTLITSPRKFVLLNIVTGGVYSMFWFWRAWEMMRKLDDKSYYSVPRSWFYIFTSFSLFPKILKKAQSVGYKKKYDPTLLALGLLVVQLLTLPLVRNGDTWVWIGTTVGVVALEILLLLPVVKANNHFVAATKKQLLPFRRDFLIWALGLLAIAISYLSLFS